MYTVHPTIIIKKSSHETLQVSFLNTGPDRLDHENKLEITKKIVTEAKESHKFLPSIIGIG